MLSPWDISSDKTLVCAVWEQRYKDRQFLQQSRRVVTGQGGSSDESAVQLCVAPVLGQFFVGCFCWRSVLAALGTVGA